ncbi:MAG: TonB-dependent receptor [Planctomycetota bacterium]|nr:MAG: TonB-dependent receptor [Planctomycetota bacterium]
MSDAADPIAQRALSINIDQQIYGTFAEIGAGQEVARWFFSVGGAAGTVAKSMSAYDMQVSDAIYGKAQRYVSRERLEEMLTHEYTLLRERLDESRGASTRFFAFADTAAAKAHTGGNDWHAWMGIRFQDRPRSAPNDVIVHVRLLDQSNSRQQDALGRLGVNLIHACTHHSKDPHQLLESLIEDVGRDRLEIDWVQIRGPAFVTVDNRLLALHLVRIGLTPAVLFGVDGMPLLASEAIRKRRVLVERGRFAPVTRLNLEMLARGGEMFALPVPNPPEGSAAPIAQSMETMEIMEITMNNLRDRGQVEDADFLARVDLLSAVKKLVLVSDLGPFHRLADYLAKRNVERTGIVLGVPLLRELFNEAHYRDLGGGILEAFGRLFTHAVRLYVYPTRDPIDGRVVTADTLKVAPHLSHLLQHLLSNGLIRSIPCEDGTLRSYSSEEVRSRICSGDPSWKELVDPAVAKIIEATGYFGARCEI